MTSRLFLVRHGETDSNRDGLALGRADPPLNDLGVQQAERLAASLGRAQLVAVYSSPLIRARQTAEPIAERSGLDVRVDESLIEMDVGELDGLDFATVRERYPEFIEKWLSDDGPDEPMPGGESLSAVADRAMSFLESVGRAEGDGAVCAVTHNFVILALLSRVLGMRLSGFRRLRHSVAGISVLERERGAWRLVRMNDTCHLE